MTEFIKSRIGLNRGSFRIWIQGEKIKNAGFKKDTGISVQYLKGKIIITKGNDRKISGNECIIDLNSKKIYDSFTNQCNLLVTLKKNRIIITEAVQ